MRTPWRWWRDRRASREASAWLEDVTEVIDLAAVERDREQAGR